MLHFLPLLCVIVLTFAEASMVRKLRIEPHPHQENLQEVANPVDPSLVKITAYRNEPDVDSGVSSISYSSEEVLGKPDVVPDNIEVFVFEEKGFNDKLVESYTKKKLVTEIGNLNEASNMNRKLLSRVRHAFNSVDTDKTTLTIEPGYGGKEIILKSEGRELTVRENGKVYSALENFNICEQHTSSTPENIHLVGNRAATKVDNKNMNGNEDHKALEDNSSDENLESTKQQNQNVNDSQSTASTHTNTEPEQKTQHRRKPKINAVDIVILIFIACVMVVWAMTAIVIYHVHF